MATNDNTEERETRQLEEDVAHWKGIAAEFEVENALLKKIAVVAYEPQSAMNQEAFLEWYHKLMLEFREYQIWISDNVGRGIDLVEYLNGKTETTTDF
jgi:hypothetical protein